MGRPSVKRRNKFHGTKCMGVSLFNLPNICLTLYSYIRRMGYAEKCCLQCKALIIATCKGCSSGNKESLNASNYNSVAPVAAAVQKYIRYCKNVTATCRPTMVTKALWGDVPASELPRRHRPI